MSNKIYRVLDEESGTYISKVAGFIRSENIQKLIQPMSTTKNKQQR